MFLLFKRFLWTAPFICFLSGYLFLTKLYPIKEIETPLVVGKTLEQACTTLSGHSLNSRLIAIKEDSLLAHGTIISQTPLAGQKIKPNQTVFIVSSSQPEKNSSPQYLQKNLNDIEQDTKQKNLSIKSYPIASIASNQSCIAQWPEVGLPLENNKMIIYVAHSAHKPILIPYLKNKPVLEVIDFLKTNSIQVDVVHNTGMQEEGHTCDNCFILDQRPLAGSIVSHESQKPVRIQLHVTSTLQ